MSFVTDPRLLDRLAHAGEVTFDPIALPERVHNPNYIRGPIAKELFVPSMY